MGDTWDHIWRDEHPAAIDDPEDSTEPANIQPGVWSGDVAYGEEMPTFEKCLVRLVYLKKLYPDELTMVLIVFKNLQNWVILDKDKCW